MRIADIENGMRHVNIEGKIVNMNGYMLVVDDESGRTFVRYSRRNLEKQIEKGNRVRISNCQAVSYSGILQLRIQPNGHIAVR
jgi:RNase P/RNase MRP subunit p29